MTTNQVATEVQGQEVQPVKRGRGLLKAAKISPRLPLLSELTVRGLIYSRRHLIYKSSSLIINRFKMEYIQLASCLLYSLLAIALYFFVSEHM